LGLEQEDARGSLAPNARKRRCIDCVHFPRCLFLLNLLGDEPRCDFSPDRYLPASEWDRTSNMALAVGKHGAAKTYHFTAALSGSVGQARRRERTGRGKAAGGRKATDAPGWRS
jgi:hypothetical protein